VTHIKENSTLDMEGYTFINHARLRQHIRAVRAFRGVGLFIKNKMLEDFSIKVLDKHYDGILGMNFTHTQSHFTMVIVVGYLPPENI
jgi:hypothetical protein